MVDEAVSGEESFQTPTPIAHAKTKPVPTNV
jgi:hypothetical protein